jgi:uncharacterized membrane protein
MRDFFANAGWILLGFFCFIVAAALIYYGFENLVKSSLGGAAAYFIGAVVFLAPTFSAFRQARK